MAKEETDIVNRIMLSESRKGVILFKNVRGMFLTLDGSRKIRAGLLADGASDLIGGTPVTITEDMVGKTILQFTAIEVKTSSGIASDKQNDFTKEIYRRGGRAGIARSPEDAEKIT